MSQIEDTTVKRPTKQSGIGSLADEPGFFRKLIDNMQIGVIVGDHDGRIVYVNDTYARFLGMDPLAAVGKHATELAVNSRLHIVARTGIPEINHPHQFQDRCFLVHRVPIREGNQIVAVLGVVLFDSASTASHLAEKVSFLESKLRVFEKELISLRSTRYTMDSIVGVSKTMETLKKDALKAATVNLPVMITGESGTGKELLAQAVHHAGSRRVYPFVRVNCAAIPKELFESELFGYAKGAFTGARSTGKPGKFELAHHGSIFLDEIGDLPLDMQPKLLRVLEDKEFERIGGTSPIKADFRLLSATNKNLEQMVAERRFREDLFYRLNVITLHIPPLRERRDDIIPTAERMLGQIAKERNQSQTALDSGAQRVLIQYDWPGNARELLNLLERLVFYREREVISFQDLPSYLRATEKGEPHRQSRMLRNAQESAEKETIQDALIRADFNKSRAAAFLGIHRSQLYKKIRKYKLSPHP
jgi:transcriptional regulator with PAS, ATPase and Fis domain